MTICHFVESVIHSSDLNCQQSESNPGNPGVLFSTVRLSLSNGAVGAGAAISGGKTVGLWNSIEARDNNYDARDLRTQHVPIIMVGMR
jgi:hypothetical protein